MCHFLYCTVFSRNLFNTITVCKAGGNKVIIENKKQEYFFLHVIFLKAGSKKLKTFAGPISLRNYYLSRSTQTMGCVINKVASSSIVKSFLALEGFVPKRMQSPHLFNARFVAKVCVMGCMPMTMLSPHLFNARFGARCLSYSEFNTNIITTLS